MACLLALPAQALTFADPIPAGFASGFDVASPEPDFVLSPFGDDFLQVGTSPGAGIEIVIDRIEEYLYEGSSGWQATLPSGLAEFTARTTWTVTQIDIMMPDDGLMLFIGGMPDTTYVPPMGGTVPDYPAGSVHVLTDAGPLGGETYEPLDQLVLHAPGVDYIYYGTRIFDVGDSIHFGYVGENSSTDGPPALFSNAGRNFVVPEPGTALLVSVGLVIMAARRTRRPGRERS